MHTKRKQGRRSKKGMNKIPFWFYFYLTFTSLNIYFLSCTCNFSAHNTQLHNYESHYNQSFYTSSTSDTLIIRSIAQLLQTIISFKQCFLIISGFIEFRNERYLSRSQQDWAPRAASVNGVLRLRNPKPDHRLLPASPLTRVCLHLGAQTRVLQSPLYRLEWISATKWERELQLARQIFFYLEIKWVC